MVVALLSLLIILLEEVALEVLVVALQGLVRQQELVELAILRQLQVLLLCTLAEVVVLLARHLLAMGRQ
jgi:hypothetical protein